MRLFDRGMGIKKMKSKFLLSIDWNRGIWIIQYHNQSGEMVYEPTEFPASTPSIVVCDAVQQARPGSTVLAKLG
jgi:hypothetical protein